MPRFLPLLLCALCLLGSASADDAVTAKMLALFSQFDADHNGSLSQEEQTKAAAAVTTTYGKDWGAQIRKMFAMAAAPDRSVNTDAWVKQVAQFGSEPTKQTFKVAMRDGVHLATDVYLPAGGARLPVVLSRTPYGRPKKGQEASGVSRNGMIYVIQDMRGRFESEGENLPFFGCGWGEHQDGVDTITWLRQQPWCNGSVVTIGGSAGGITQNLLAGAAPEGLKAQYISVAASSLYQDATYTGGALRKADMENWTTQNKFDPRGLALMRSHPAYDDYWKQFDTSQKYEVMNVPAIHLGGWFDIFTQGTLDEFTGRQYSGSAGSRGAQKVIIGPWAHALGKMPVGELTFPNSAVPPQFSFARWFDHYLFDISNGIDKEPAVTYYVMGDAKTPGAPGNEWRHAGNWPVPSTETAFYFSRDHLLQTAKPAGNPEAPLEYTYDPANPCPTVGGNNLTLEHGPMNQNRIENRGDVLCFTSAPLEEPLEVTGRVKAKIFVSSSAVDTDLSIRLCDVYPDGKSYMIAEGMLRLRYRHSLSQPELLTPDKLEEVTVDCWSTSIIFNRGHSIRSTVTSSNYPRFDLNPGTGQPWQDGAPHVKQVNRIQCDAAHPSGMLLPVVKREAQAAIR